MKAAAAEIPAPAIPTAQAPAAPPQPIETQAVETAPTAEAPPEEAAAEPAPESDQEENIYEVMKQHMVRQKEEQEARNAQMKAQRAYGRPAPAAAPAVVVVEKASDLADLPGVWTTARNYLSHHARLLESVLGASARIESMNIAAAEIVLAIPNTHQNFTNDKARAKLEEALRAVTGAPLKLHVNFVEPREAPPGSYSPNGSGPANAPLAAAQRIPPEIMDAVKRQPIVQELMKRLDATVTQVEILEEKGEALNEGSNS